MSYTIICQHDPFARIENEANGGTGCPLCNREQQQQQLTQAMIDQARQKALLHARHLRAVLMLESAPTYAYTAQDPPPGAYCPNPAQSTHVYTPAPRITMYKVWSNGTIQPANNNNLPQNVAWLLRNGYRQFGAFLGEEDKILAVLWLTQYDQAEFIGQLLGLPIYPATVQYKDGRFRTTRTKPAIKRSRRRNRAHTGDLAFVRLPTLAARIRTYGVIP